MVVMMDRTGLFVPAHHDLPLVRLEPTDPVWLHGKLAGTPTASDLEPAPETCELLERHMAYLHVATVPAESRTAEPPWASADPADVLVHMVTPIAFAASAAGFDLVDHDGAVRVRLDARQMCAMPSFVEPRVVSQVRFDHHLATGALALDNDEFDRLLGILRAQEIVDAIDQSQIEGAEGRAERELRTGVSEVMRRSVDVAAHLETLAAEERARTERTGRARTRVVPVNSEGHPILSLGLAMAYAEAYDGGRLSERYEFVPDWADLTVPALAADAPPAVYLFSNYIWSHAWNVSRSEEVKAKNPPSITVHGGPNTPKYEEDINAFFGMNPHVDVAVHGEGEAALAEILDALDGCFDDGAQPDLSVLRDVPGITFRLGDELVQTEKRDRITDLDTVPSPFLTGLFDNIGESEIYLMTIETNRGCPYGCSFCDWGSATMSRIRKFDIDRVFAELEWCAQHKVKMIFCADANFGIFARDVDIARKIVELKKEYGYPRTFESSYAKNTVKHLREIIEILSAGGVLSTGTLSLQSLDQDTLYAIRRSNISVKKYEDLAVEFGNNDLPLVMELMMGLPGSTVTSFLADLQQIIDREVRARVNPTEVLMNSPMNDPEYRAENAIELLRPINHDWRESFTTRKKSLVVSTSTFTRDDYRLMERYRLVFLLCENFGVLRQVSRFVRQAAGLSETEFYVRFADDVYATDRWPGLRIAFDVVSEYMVPPVSWRLFIDELGDYLRDELGIPDDSALATVLTVQQALLPARGRDLPVSVELAHDFGAWHHQVLECKRAGGSASWPTEVPPLSTFGPARFEVDDPQMVASYGMGMSLFYDGESDWELASPVARPIRFRHTIHV
jgi:radical SAM superfamily enzyme YgiQ (UPF0313 family)